MLSNLHALLFEWIRQTELNPNLVTLQTQKCQQIGTKVLVNKYLFNYYYFLFLLTNKFRVIHLILISLPLQVSESLTVGVDVAPSLKVEPCYVPLLLAHCSTGRFFFCLCERCLTMPDYERWINVWQRNKTFPTWHNLSNTHKLISQSLKINIGKQLPKFWAIYTIYISRILSFVFHRAFMLYIFCLCHIWK